MEKGSALGNDEAKRNHNARITSWSQATRVYPTPSGLLPEKKEKKFILLNLFVIAACVYAQSCPNLCNPMDCSPPGSSIHGIYQASILEWVAICSSQGSSQPGIEPMSLASPALAGRFFATMPPGEPTAVHHVP